jgi:hypothetical protein
MLSVPLQIILILAFAMLTMQQMYQNAMYYSDSACSGVPVAQASLLTNSTCYQIGCTPTLGLWGKVTCTSTFTVLTGGYALTSYSTQNCDATNNGVSSYSAFRTGVCIPYGDGAILQCGAGNAVVNGQQYAKSNWTCSGASTPMSTLRTTAGVCVSEGTRGSAIVVCTSAASKIQVGFVGLILLVVTMIVAF